MSGKKRRGTISSRSISSSMPVIFPTRAAGPTAYTTGGWGACAIPMLGVYKQAVSSRVCDVSVMNLDELDEGVEPVAQKAPVLSRGHAVEQLEELFLLLGGSPKHVLCLCMLSSAFGRAERTRGWG